MCSPGRATTLLIISMPKASDLAPTMSPLLISLNKGFLIARNLSPSFATGAMLSPVTFTIFKNKRVNTFRANSRAIIIIGRVFFFFIYKSPRSHEALRL